MEIVSQNDSLPVIRQLPGAENSLGKAKFLFPNSYDIYFHDTPAKEIFNRTNRAASHGCIRLADVEKMATYLLRDQSDWTPEKIRAAMNSGKEQKVAVSHPVPVFITYYTAWIDENGQLNFRNDIYGHDAKTGSKMFGPKPVTRIS
jgi:murein L,D-transpeptidase YcbB/YkuD